MRQSFQPALFVFQHERDLAADRGGNSFLQVKIISDRLGLDFLFFFRKTKYLSY